ncbi:hypothetical protein PT241_05610 [Erysipelothrix rhusiopathiae]|nr:hypothetical protein [Erysipelothrix rhusiopathiae]MDE8240153.1 hypothetical protein [Erysipelothrix rhusiopathiae]MDE8288477.1 hypothetical protein [Erysipelothrix rhusiopathiae]MDE8338212.1 hypothetical protein [Erysipelothrix rhusiopathiae]
MTTIVALAEVDSYRSLIKYVLGLVVSTTPSTILSSKAVIELNGLFPIYKKSMASQ